MVTLDRRAWRGGESFVVHGVRFGVRVSEPAVLPRLTDHLPPGFTVLPSPVVDHLYSVWIDNSQTGEDRSDPADARFHLYVGPRELARTATLDALLDRFESSLHHTVAVSARDKLFVHAGVVGWQGRAIVIPGPSYSGKSTFVAELVRAGASYYSDEFAVFDGQGRVHPYRRRLSLRTGSTRTRYPVEAVSGPSGTAALSVGLIAITAYRAGAHWDPKVPTPAQALLALFQNTVVARIRPELALSTLRRVVPRALLLQSDRGEARDTVAPLLHALARGASRHPAPGENRIAA